MTVSRREFFRYCVASATSLGLLPAQLKALHAALASSNLPKVVWLHGASCNGCSVSLLNRIADTAPATTVDDLLINNIDLIYHTVVMSAAGDLAVSALKQQISAGGYVLVVEGGVSTAFGGHACTVWTENGKDVTFQDALKLAASKAVAIISAGTCAAYGGIPAAGPNPTGIQSVSAFLGKPTVNIPGCAMHPDWFIGTVVQFILGNPIDLDEFGRPTAIFGRTIHSTCPYNPANGSTAGYATTFGGSPKCLRMLGCRGPGTFGNCDSLRWNNGVSWCAQSGAPCIGCTEPTFPGPDPLYAPIYG
ncbi:MAG: hydrogenase small subunit [Verrucomicrobia bacterium]|nr:hydrogenase small subunit [Verrucomicrobiota bacterium]